MTPQELKNSILQRAIQGRLVEQRPEEGTGEELYREIQAEKQRLIRAGKIRKEKPLPEITEDEIPFDIPESWKWVHFNSISSNALGKTLDKEKNKGQYCPYLCSINVYWGKIDLSTVKQARFEEQELAKYELRPGDLLVCEGGEVGRTAIWNLYIPMYYQNALHRIRFYGKILPSFYMYLMECYKGIGIIDNYSKGVTIKHFVQSSLNLMWIPLPPLAEQRRIVAKIEELLPYLDRYTEAWNRLETFNKRFPSDLRKSLLQLAIQGRLVEQRPEEGTGEELYQAIQREKRRRIQAGELKWEKPLPEIAEDEIPFEIPESWMWVRLGEAFVIERGGSPRPIKNYLTDADDGVNWIKIGDTDKGGKYINGTKEKIIPAGVSKSRVVHKGDFLLSNSMSFGRPYILNIDGCIHDGWLVLRFIGQAFDRDYLYYLLSSPMVFHQFTRRVAGAVVNNLNSDKVALTVVPVPPIAEQRRIVARVEEMLPLCDTIGGSFL